MRRVCARALLLSPLVLVSAVGGGYAARLHSTAAPTATRVQLAQRVNPVGAHGYTLGLSHVTIPAGTQLALHRHPGTQLAYIQRGVLTYSVRNGSVTVMRGPADQSPKVVRRIRAGQTGRIRAGEWIVELPSTVHQGRTAGRAPVSIMLATLFTNGSPPSVPVK